MRWRKVRLKIAVSCRLNSNLLLFLALVGAFAWLWRRVAGHNRSNGTGYWR